MRNLIRGLILALLVGIFAYGIFAIARDLGKRQGACTALTGSPACDWSKVRSCLVEDHPRVPLPCVWLPGRDGNDLGQIVVFLEHPCPPLPDGVKCIDTTGKEYDE